MRKLVLKVESEEQLNGIRDELEKNGDQVGTS